MKILGDKWMDGYLDYHRMRGDVRIAVRAWWIISPIRDVFLEQPRSIRRVLNYINEVGVKETLRKIQSRWAERLRDQRFVAIGVGQIAESDDRSRFSVGERVVFFAPNHPKCVERIVLPEAMVTHAPVDLPGTLSSDGMIGIIDARPPAEAHDCDALAGWSPFSGVDPTSSALAAALWARRVWSQAPLPEARYDTIAASPVAERTAGPVSRRDGRSAVLFGLGNYAKVCVLPNLDPRIRVDCIHEIEPTQLGANPPYPARLDSSPAVRPDEDYDIYLIAGYHHTHADLAIHALTRGGWAVVEKPLVTTREQLARLLDAQRSHPGRYFAGFHMRYNPLWDMAREDLGQTGDRPIQYNCIVFEVPLVKRHWYNWPNSRSRIVSNGCHWLDHFMFMNGYAPVRRHELWLGCNQTVNVSVELENDAVMTMALTDVGCRRIGVQDHVQMRAGEITVRVDTQSRYMSEDRLRIIRRKRVNRLLSTHRMYAEISKRIMDARAGDDIATTERSTQLMLDLEDRYQHAKLQRSQGG